MVGSLANKAALVTGASQGIGRAIALAFAEEGADVVITARSTEALEAAASEIRATGRRAHVVTADLAQEADIDRLATEATEAFGRLDVLVNNAAALQDFSNLVDFDPAVWRNVIDVNLVAPALLTRAILPKMIEQQSGTVIFISSMGGRKGGAGRSAYRASKAALINLTESVAAEVKEFGIDANCICVGSVRTEGWEAHYTGNSRPTHQVMPPSEIAKLAVFLASDASSPITGTAIDAWGVSNPLFRR